MKGGDINEVLTNVSLNSLDSPKANMYLCQWILPLAHLHNLHNTLQNIPPQNSDFAPLSVELNVISDAGKDKVEVMKN